jgi:hypothetical protein
MAAIYAQYTATHGGWQSSDARVGVYGQITMKNDEMMIKNKKTRRINNSKGSQGWEKQRPVKEQREAKMTIMDFPSLLSEDDIQRNRVLQVKIEAERQAETQEARKRAKEAKEIAKKEARKKASKKPKAWTIPRLQLNLINIGEKLKIDEQGKLNNKSKAKGNTKNLGQGTGSAYDPRVIRRTNRYAVKKAIDESIQNLSQGKISKLRRAKEEYMRTLKAKQEIASPIKKSLESDSNSMTKTTPKNIPDLEIEENSESTDQLDLSNLPKKIPEVIIKYDAIDIHRREQLNSAEFRSSYALNITIRE